MKVYGLVGRSGTGKSHHALAISNHLGADCIVDDGLLIWQSCVRAGYSAKFEPTRIAAIRRAVFADALHRQEVHDAFRLLAPNGCLVLGTSKEMVLQICERIELPKDDIEWLRVEEVLDASKIQAARELRSDGRHAVPITQVQIEQPGALLHYVSRLIERIRVPSPATGTLVETAPVVVRPIFVDGSVYLSRRALYQCVTHFIETGEYPFQLKHFQFHTEPFFRFHLTLHALWQKDISSSAKALHRELTHYLRGSLGIPYPHIDIQIVSISPLPSQP